MSHHYPSTVARRVGVTAGRLLVFFCLVLASCQQAKAPLSGRQDPDHDGVARNKDKCPDTPAGVRVDANGCPLDADGDGLEDYRDGCPDQAGTSALGGCPDRDNDGVADAQDSCPDTPGPVENQGCPPKRMKAARPPLSPAEAREAALAAREQAEDKRRVTVFFCTNRNLVKAPPLATFGTRSAAPRYGSARVNIPRDHQLGMVEVPMSFFGLELELPDPNKHVMILATRLLNQEELLRQMNEKSSASERKDAFVFVHGFNNTFEQAMLRTAQFTYDLGFQGAPVLFSWPSQGSASPFSYRTDEQMSAAAVGPFKDFLRAFLGKSTAVNIYLIAHSMGNRVMLAALQDLMAKEPALFRNKHVREIVLTAPDVGVDVFKQQIAPIIKKGQTNVTLYASDDDKALKVSRMLNKKRRAGQAGAGLVLLPGLETIDATGVETDFLAHSYFASNGSVVGDLYFMFAKSLRAKKRSGLLWQQNRNYWKVKQKGAAGPGTGG